MNSVPSTAKSSIVRFPILGLFILFTISVKAQQSIKLPKWQPYDFEFRSTVASSNPFIVSFYAAITGPNGVRLKLPGFYDGNKTWKIRFSPTMEGTWLMVTHSGDSSLNNQRATILCIKNKNRNLHGGLVTDTGNTHHFRFEDGTHWFPNGYECNWLWALDEKDNELPTMKRFLDKLTKYGFNFILINAYSYDTKWRAGKTEAADYGPSALYPWEGDNKSSDFSRYNLAYWQHYDRMIHTLYQRGMVAYIYFKVYNKEVAWMKNASAEDDQYYRWIIARYAAYPNIIWDLAKEANYEKSIDYKINRLKFIRSTDPYKRLLTVHTDIQTYDKGWYDSLVNFRSHQEQSAHLHQTTLKQLKQHAWPVFNIESGYEYGPKGPGDKTYNRVHSPEETVTFLWEVQMAGGYNAYYYTYTAWDVIRTDDTPPGYGYLKNFKDFFAKTKYWLLQPADSLVSTGYCLANTGKEYVVFQKEPGSFSLTLTGISKPLKAKWFHPFSGKYIDAGKLQNGVIQLVPPPGFHKGPIVLYAGN